VVLRVLPGVPLNHPSVFASCVHHRILFWNRTRLPSYFLLPEFNLFISSPPRGLSTDRISYCTAWIQSTISQGKQRGRQEETPAPIIRHVSENSQIIRLSGPIFPRIQVLYESAAIRPRGKYLEGFRVRAEPRLLLGRTNHRFPLGPRSLRNSFSDICEFHTSSDVDTRSSLLFRTNKSIHHPAIG
jgi:hypothetical protein